MIKNGTLGYKNKNRKYPVLFKIGNRKKQKRNFSKRKITDFGLIDFIVLLQLKLK